MIINNNLHSLVVRRHLLQHSSAVSRVATRLSTGKRINTAADDAAGMVVVNKMRSQIMGLNQANRNILDGISLSRTASGTLQEASDILGRMRELAVQAANDTLTGSDRIELQREFRLLGEELDQIANTTTFNGMRILDGSSSLVASTDSNLLEAYLNGSNPSPVEDLVGHYRLAVNTSGGRGQVKNSNIMGLTGSTVATNIDTVPEGCKVSGLQSFSATGLAAGDYRVQTRAMPFGGLFYIDGSGNEVSNPAATLGINSITTTSTPNIMATGLYTVETAKEVPFMAKFDTNVIRGVQPNNCPETIEGRRYLDVLMDMRVAVSSTNSESEIAWRDLQHSLNFDFQPTGKQIHPDATGISFSTRDNNNLNLYTQYEVTAQQDRQRLLNNIDLYTYYRSVIESNIELELTYKAGSAITMGATYHSVADSEINMELSYLTAENAAMEATVSYEAKADETVVAITEYLLLAGKTVTVDVGGNGSKTFTAGENIALSDIANALNTYFLAEGIEEVSFSLSPESVDGQRKMIVTNNTNANITVSGDGADNLGLGIVDLAHDSSHNGTLLDYDKAHSFEIEADMDIEKIAEEIFFEGDYTNITVTVENRGEGKNRLVANNGAINYRLTFDSNGEDSVVSELGLVDMNNINPSEVKYGIEVYHNHTFDIVTSTDSNIENLTLVGIREAITHTFSVAEVNIGNFSVTVDDANHGSNMKQLSFVNNSIYRVAFNDKVDSSTAGELGFHETVITRVVSDDKNSLDSNAVFYGSINLTGGVSVKTIAEIAGAINAALNSALVGEHNGSFTVTSGSENQRALSITNNSLYRLQIDSSTALSKELGLNEYGTRERGSEAWGSEISFLHNYSFTAAVTGQTLEQIKATIAERINNVNATLGVTTRHIEDFTVTYNTDQNISSLTFSNSGANSIYNLSLSGITASELVLSTVERGAENVQSRQFYDGHIETVNVGDMRITGDTLSIEQALNDALNGLEPTLFKWNNLFSATIAGEGLRKLDFDNSNTFYEVIIRDVDAHQAAEELGIDRIVARGTEITDATARHYENSFNTINAADFHDIEGLYDVIKNYTDDPDDWLTVKWTIGLEPDYNGENHHGQFEITNNHNTSDRLELVFAAGEGTSALFAVNTSTDISINHLGNATSPINNTENTDTWLARDNMTVEGSYYGISNSGHIVSGDFSNLTWWRGDDGTTNPLANDVHFGSIPFDSIFIPENPEISPGEAPDRLATGDSWTLFTRAYAGAGATLLDFSLDDHDSGEYAWGNWAENSENYGGGSYAFRAGLLDNRNLTDINDFGIPQLYRDSSTESGIVYHQIEFGDIAPLDRALVYNQRYDNSDFNHYAHAYYGNETTYFFQNGNPWEDFLGDIEVNRQLESNATLLFTYLGSDRFDIRGRVYERNGEFRDIRLEQTLGPGSANINIDGILFESLQVSTAGMLEDDKFVINVAARAGQGIYGDQAYSDDHIALEGDPFLLGDRFGYSMQYRFDSGAVNGREVEVMGFVIDPTRGAEGDVGVWTGRPIISVTGGGFTAGTRFGGDQEVRLEINYHGTTEHVASSLINGYYFQQMQKGELVVDFIEAFTYEKQQTQNASVLFDVLQVKEDRIFFRAQAHIYGRDGEYRYEFEEYFSLEKENQNVTLFGNCGPGLTFSRIDFQDLARLCTGDRFSLSLAANAEPDDSDHDEVYLWSNAFRQDIYPHSWRFENGVLDNRLTSLRTYQVNYGNGIVYDAEMKLDFSAFHGGTDIGSFSDNATPRDVQETVQFTSAERETAELGVAHRYTRLSDIAQFITPEGRFLLEKPVVLTIHQGDRSAQVVLHAEDEVMAVVDRINQAIYEELGQNRVVSEADRFKFASFVNSPFPGSDLDVMEGSLVIRSALPGEEGDLVFSGDEVLLRALGLSIIRESAANSYSVDVKSIGSEKVLAKGIKVSGNEAPNILPGVTLRFDSMLGIEKVEFERCAEDFRYVTEQSEDVYVRLADRSKALHVGANPGQITRLDLGDVSKQALGLGNESILNRNLANRAIARIDNATAQVSAQRSNLGALENRLEHSTNRITVTAENLTQAESRIRDADIAMEFLHYVRKQLLAQIGYSMLAQANMERGRILNLIH